MLRMLPLSMSARPQHQAAFIDKAKVPAAQTKSAGIIFRSGCHQSNGKLLEWETPERLASGVDIRLLSDGGAPPSCRACVGGQSGMSLQGWIFMIRWSAVWRRTCKRPNSSCWLLKISARTPFSSMRRRRPVMVTGSPATGVR